MDEVDRPSVAERPTVVETTVEEETTVVSRTGIQRQPPDDSGVVTVGVTVDDHRTPQDVHIQVTLPTEEAPPKLTPPVFIEPLAPLIVRDGQPVTFRAVVHGEPMPEIKWFRNGEEIDVEEYPEFTIECIDKVCTLKLEEAFPEDTGQITIKAANPAGAVTSTAKLLVTGAVDSPVYLCMVLLCFFFHAD